MVGEDGRVAIEGRVAASRASRYTYEVAFAPGVQPPRWPLGDTWTAVATGSGTGPRAGELARLDMKAVRAAVAAAPPVYTPLDDPTSPDHPEKDAFRVRVTVHADGDRSTPWKTAIAQRQLFAAEHTGNVAGFPRYLDADGASSPAFADLDGDGRDELVVSDGNGFVHAFTAGGGEARGWPVRTERLPLHRWPETVHSPTLLGSPAVADLDGDGNPEVAVATIGGQLHVWHADGSPADGFPVRPNPAFSEEPGCQLAEGPLCDDFTHDGNGDVRDHVNTVDPGFASAPSVGDLDRGRPGLELVAGALDGHVYAWHADGTPVTGWPVLLRDPAKVAKVHPTTHKITFKPDSDVRLGRQVLTTPTLADVDADGDLEVAVNVNEEYEEPPNWGLRDPSLAAITVAATPGNTRVYLLHHDGTRHAGTPKVANLGDNAYVSGWPARIAMFETELLPVVGVGSNGAPVVADVDGDGTAEIATMSIGSPPYLLKVDGTSYYGNGPDGKYLTMATSPAEFKSGATDGPSFASLGGAAWGRLGGDDSALALATPGTGLRRALDVVLPDQQLAAEDHVSAFDPATGTYLPGFPACMNDLQFFNTPAIADVSGDGRAEVLEGSAMYDVRAYGLGGTVPTDWPKFVGGWVVETPAIGDLDGDGASDVAVDAKRASCSCGRPRGRRVTAAMAQVSARPSELGRLRDRRHTAISRGRPGDHPGRRTHRGVVGRAGRRWSVRHRDRVPHHDRRAARGGADAGTFDSRKPTADRAPRRRPLRHRSGRGRRRQRRHPVHGERWRCDALWHERGDRADDRCSRRHRTGDAATGFRTRGGCVPFRGPPHQPKGDLTHANPRRSRRDRRPRPCRVQPRVVADGGERAYDHRCDRRRRSR